MRVHTQATSSIGSPILAVPVEDRSQTGAVDDDVAGAHVGVDDAPCGGFGRAVLAQPTQHVRERRLGLQQVGDRDRHAVERRRHRFGGRGHRRRRERRVDRVQPAERIAELGDDVLAVADFGHEAQETTGDGLAVVELADEELAAEHRLVDAHRHHLGHRHAVVAGDRAHGGLVGHRQDRDVGRRQHRGDEPSRPRPTVDLQHQVAASSSGGALARDGDIEIARWAAPVCGEPVAQPLGLRGAHGAPVAVS